jgi:hypothetical protein
LDQVQPWPLSAALTLHLTPQHPSKPLHPSLLVTMTKTQTMPATLSLHMLTPSPLPSKPLHHVSCLPLTLLKLLLQAIDQDDVDTAQATRAQTRPDTPSSSPGRAPGRLWTRQDAAMPRRLAPPLALPWHQSRRHGALNLPDMLTCPRSPCSRRHG